MVISLLIKTIYILHFIYIIDMNNKKEFPCEECSQYECNCFCICWLTHSQCMCWWQPEDFESTEEKRKKQKIDDCYVAIRNKLSWTWLKLDNTKEEFIKEVLRDYIK